MIVLTKDQAARLHAIAASKVIDAAYDDMLMTMVEAGVSDAEDYIVGMELCQALAEGMDAFAKYLRKNGTSNEDILLRASYLSGFAVGKMTAFDPIKREDEAYIINDTMANFCRGFRNYATAAPDAPKATHPGNTTKN